MASYHQHGSAIDLSGFKVQKHLVDIVELRLVNLRFDLTLGGECNCLCQIFTAAYDRAANGFPVQDHIEDGSLKFPRWKTDKADGALSPHHLERLRESCRRYCSH